MGEGRTDEATNDPQAALTGSLGAQVYRYLGDRLTREDLRGARCRAILDERRKCIRSRHTGTMLVEFESGERSNIIARRLRKIEERERENG